jgi:histidinol-phosphate aminotransferase
MAGLALLEPDSEVVFSDPPFALYPLTAAHCGCRAVAVPHKDLAHDLERIAAACTDKTRLIFLSNPYNPTGTIFTQREVDRFLGDVPETAVVVLDEAYFEYVDSPDYPRSLEYVREGRPVMVLRTFSKIYALAGLRVGYGFMPEVLADGLKRACAPFNVSTIGLAAAQASLEDDEQVRCSQQMVGEGKAYLYREFERLGLEYVPTQANFIFVDAGIHSRMCFDGLIRRGVTIRTGDIFGLPTWIRVTVGTELQNEAFVERLGEVLEACER